MRIALSLLAALLLSSDGASPGGLRAILEITRDRHLESKWSHTAGSYAVTIPRAGEAYRGEVVFVTLLIADPALGPGGRSGVVFDYEILRPDGVVYDEGRGVRALEGPVPPRAGFLLSGTSIGIRFEEDDPFGRYRVRLVVRDEVRGETVALEEAVELVPFRYETGAGDPIAVDRFLMDYHGVPKPHRIFEFLAAAAADPNVGADPHVQGIAGEFLARVFEDNPHLLPHLAGFLDRFEGGRADALRAVLARTAVENPGAVPEAWRGDEPEPRPRDLTDEVYESAGELDYLWARFFATGEIEPVRRIALALPLQESGDIARSVIGGSARWSLGSNAEQHPLVRAYLEHLRANDRDLPKRVRRVVGEILDGLDPPAGDGRRGGP